jgi:hypothetical protein
MYFVVSQLYICFPYPVSTLYFVLKVSKISFTLVLCRFETWSFTLTTNIGGGCDDKFVPLLS